MGLELKAGTHEVALKYTPAGFKEGVIVSAVSVFCIALLTFIPALIRKNSSRKSSAATEATGAAAEAVSEASAPEMIEEISVSEVFSEEAKAEEVTESEDRSDTEIDAVSEESEEGSDSEVKGE